MKNYYLLIILTLGISFALVSCDPGYCLSTRIENRTNKDISLYFVSTEFIAKGISNNTIIDTLKIENGDIGIKESGCTLGNFDPSDFFFEFYDSIFIEDSNSEILKVYYPDSTGKNIYDTENRDVWKLDKKGKDDYEYTFEITQEDISRKQQP